MGSYYYLAAQLPYLVYGQQPPMSSAAFRDLVKPSLNAGDAEALECCTLEPLAAENQGKAEFISKWYQWEEALRRNLARGRRQKLKREEAVSDAPEYPADAAAAAKTALTMDSPLEAEFFLDKARWNAIEAFSGIQYFSENTIFAYLLKLLLMERRQSFNTEEGFAEYKTLYASILENAGEPK